MYKAIYRDRVELKDTKLILWDGFGDYVEIK